jgi:uncharacterized protein (TIGR00251 family)
MSTRLELKVVPRASRSEIAGWIGDALRIRVAVPPEKGKANRAVESLVAQALDLPVKAVRIVSGRSSPRKVVEVDGLTLSEIRERLSV